MSKVLCLDPSGNFAEGSGTTGWAFFEDRKLTGFGDVKSSNYETDMKYWNTVIRGIEAYSPDIVVCESFKLFAHKAKQLHWSALETPQIIGAIRMACYNNDIKIVMQDPKCKVGVTDAKLEKLGVWDISHPKSHATNERVGASYVHINGKLTNIHQRDAIRHGVYYFRYGEGKVQ